MTSLNRPGGNVTGVTFLGGVVGAKRLELLRLLVPKAIKIGMLVSPNYPDTEAEREDVKAGTQRTTQPIILEIRDGDELDGAFAALIAQGVEALMVGTGAFLFSRRSRIAALAAKYRLPASYSNREGVEAGGLMSYGPSIADAYRQGGIYVGRVLNGEKPADLPVMQSGKFEFVLNLKTAKDLGLEFHPQLLATRRRGHRMSRREFLTLLGAAGAAWPVGAKAQQVDKPVVAYLMSRSENDAAYLAAGFREGLRSGGFIEGHNVHIEYRWADGQFSRLPAMAAGACSYSGSRDCGGRR